MKAVLSISLVGAAALTLAACGDGSGSRDFIRAVGSSTVYPFAKAVSESFSRDYPEFKSPVIEAIGSGAGIASFCEGQGPNTPDIANASRRMKASEFATCQANGVNDIVEIQVGLDGIAFAAANNGISMNLTPKIVYEALAANPYGEPQTAENWSDVDPSLPDLPILVYGPPSTSGTRDALKELVLEPGCATNSEMEALEASDEDQYDRVCTEVRSDGAYVDQGEQDNLIVQKIESNPNSVGIFGYSYLEENLDRLSGLRMNGVEPTYDNIASFEYPGARPLYMYVKKTHINAIPGLKQYLAQWPKMWEKGGRLASIGLVASPPEAAAASAEAATQYTTLDGSQLQ
ncbi:phosphate ABC transporter substrate-binding protein [Erythrobacter litoralis]|uniref:substrate-binding domain-containing protein n=1 Tax=Erythrobacter litoralis TaxID=39960 RepID=UPI002435A70D|nr:substrate-binding domain-containing protein [Erythrobacter litoralis]MDG6079650.1 phosphate ABC transporter substrate-binding protein [Erythrobacter litoralis]